MPLKEELRDLNIQSAAPATAQTVSFGAPVPKIQRLKILSPDDWEIITEQWASTLNGKYSRVRRLGGSGDKGIDIVRSEERRVGKEWRSGWWSDHYQEKTGEKRR